MTDQFYCAQKVPKLGISPESIWRKNLTAKRLASALQTAVSDANMQQKCRVLAEKLGGHDSYAHAERFIREVFMK